MSNFHDSYEHEAQPSFKFRASGLDIKFELAMRLDLVNHSFMNLI
jgi:hypothetical protein